MTLEHRAARTWTLGNLALFLFGAEAATGVGLMFHYRPTVDSAYLDLLDLQEASPFSFLRELHSWGSHAILIVVWLHLLQVVLRGSYLPPRRSSWAVGAALAVLTLWLAATGSLLPWDEGAFWGIAAAEPSVSGVAPSPKSVDGSTLLRSYVLHCVVLPLLAAALAAHHVRRARRDAQPAGEPTGEPKR